MSDVFRVGLIGAGFGSQVHLPVYQASDKLQVVGLVSRTPEHAEEIARRFNVLWWGTDYRRMVDELELDLVVITAPGSLHHEMALTAIAAGRNVLCEKPLAVNVAQAEEMLRAARQAGIVHAVNHEFRCVPARLKMKQLVDSGYLGILYDVRLIGDGDMLLNTEQPWTWWSDRQQYGGLMQAHVSHLIDFVLWTFGDIASVSALVSTFIRSRPAENGTRRQVTSDDQDAALLRLASGATGSMHASGVYRAPRNVIEAHGSEGSLVIEDGKLLGAQGSSKLAPIDTPELPTGQDFRIPLFGAYMAHLARALAGEADDFIATFEQGVRVQAVMDALHRSSDEGIHVSIQAPAGPLSG